MDSYYRCCIIAHGHLEAYTALPDTLTVREIRYQTAQRGKRTRSITLVTTLLDPQAYPATELAKLYQQRWQIEICQPNCTSSVSCCCGNWTGYDSGVGVAGIGPMDGATRRESIRRILMSDTSRSAAPPRADERRRHQRRRGPCRPFVCLHNVSGNFADCSVR